GPPCGPPGPATAVAARPPRPRAPARTGTRAGRGARSEPATTQAGIRPRRRPDSRGGHAGATRANGTTSAGASRPDDDEPAALVQHFAASELVGERGGSEVTLVDGPAGAVVEDALLNLVALPVWPDRGVGDHKLRR